VGALGSKLGRSELPQLSGLKHGCAVGKKQLEVCIRKGTGEEAFGESGALRGVVVGTGEGLDSVGALQRTARLEEVKDFTDAVQEPPHKRRSTAGLSNQENSLLLLLLPLMPSKDILRMSFQKHRTATVQQPHQT
jgi:hypothetical protein